jgi:outer membrane protein OmpA-like peptidoglycan-associated protein
MAAAFYKGGRRGECMSTDREWFTPPGGGFINVQKIQKLPTRNRIRAALSIAAFSTLAAAGLGCAAPAHETKVIMTAVPFEERHLWSTSVEPVEVLVREEGINRTMFVGFSEQVAKACGPSAEGAPRFAFDSAKLSSQHHRELRALADCLTSGPLKGRNVHIVGNTDPRGDFDENAALGELRAETVRDFLTTHGVARERILVTSRGEMGAVGRAETSWSKDRRVDILLAGEAPADDAGWE